MEMKSTSEFDNSFVNEEMDTEGVYLSANNVKQSLEYFLSFTISDPPQIQLEPSIVKHLNSSLMIISSISGHLKKELEKQGE